MRDYRFKIFLPLSSSSLEDGSLFANTLDIGLQEASLGMVTGTAIEAGCCVVNVEANDEAHALKLIRSLVASLSVASSTQIRVLGVNGEDNIVPTSA